jgi:hypothetical protein
MASDAFIHAAFNVIKALRRSTPFHLSLNASLKIWLCAGIQQDPGFLGAPKTFNIPAKLVSKVRQQVAMRHRFDAAAATICGINLRRFLKEKEDQ